MTTAVIRDDRAWCGGSCERPVAIGRVREADHGATPMLVLSQRWHWSRERGRWEHRAKLRAATGLRVRYGATN